MKLPVLAKTLEAVASQGSAYIYEGAWAKECVSKVIEAGGKISLDDLSGYAPEWSDPLHITYRGRDLYGLNGHDSGGLRLMLALKVLENADVRKLGHYSESLDALETMIRVSRAVNAGSFLTSQSFFDDPKASQVVLDSDKHKTLWQDVVTKTDRTSLPRKGTHSYCVAVIDAQGNAVAGTHTIESLPFGSGIFVGGAPLNNTAIQHSGTSPGSCIIEPLSAILAFDHNQLVLASTTFSASLWPADLQIIVGAIDFDWNPERIALTPRFGSYPLDLNNFNENLDATMLDKRFSKRVVDELLARGVRTSQAGYIDTGMLVIIKRDSATGRLTGFTPEQLPDGKARGF